MRNFEPQMNADNARIVGTNYLRASACICGCLLLVGCHAPAHATREPYFGPTDPLKVVVNDVNARVENLSTLRAAGDFEATIVENGKKHFVNGDMTLLYARPDKLRMVGKKDIVGNIFEIGTNGRQYWLIVRGDTDTMWYGEYAKLADASERARSRIPVRPDLLLEVLGVSAINTNLMTQPFPIMRFNNDYDVYMITWNIQLADRMAAQREVWYDRKTKLPTLVLLFDENGRVLLSAKLAKHRPVEVPNVNQDQWPQVATSYRIQFPESGTRISFELSDVALTRNGAPNDRTFGFPGADRAGVSHVINVDDDEQLPRE